MIGWTLQEDKAKIYMSRRFPLQLKRPKNYPSGGCRRVVDTSQTIIEAEDWLGGGGKDSKGDAERRAEALLKANEGVLRDFKIYADIRRRNNIPTVSFTTSTRVGALPLRSPVTGHPDFGLIVEPRFSWSSIGEVLNATGFRIVPQLLPYPDLPQSDRNIPPWVLSSIVLVRVQRLLEKISRRFVVVLSDLSTPKGLIDWGCYATQKLAFAKHLSVPCSFPDLRDDENLRSAIHFVLREHHSSLTSRRSDGVVVLKLLALCEELLNRVSGTPPIRPRASQVERWKQQPLSSQSFTEGLQAIEWTMEERGLAGLSELSGLSWRMDMEEFFEAWTETIAASISKKCGAILKSGRLRQTRVALDWRPSYLGSQRSLIPDVVIHRDDVTMVLDAKYKQHAEEIRFSGWGNVADEIRERHRADMLQVLAYTSLFDTPRVIACLVYPCRLETFQSLKERGQLIARTVINSGQRQVELVLVSAPISGEANALVSSLAEAFQTPL